MQSKIIEKILNENNKSLQEIIEIVKNNAVFQNVMSDFKEEFFIDDNIHGISHNERVALLACYIGIQEGLNDGELRLVLETAKYHDIGRGFEGNHGQYSAVIIDRNQEHIFPNLSDDEINTIKALCHGHSVDDNKYIEIAKLYGIENIEKFKRLLDIVKDSDALDRVRLPRFGQFEEKYLRTETSKRIIDFSKELFRKYIDIQQELPNENSREYDAISNHQANKGLRSQLLFDGENYYLVRSLNKLDIENFDKENGIIPKIDNNVGYTAQDVMAQIRMQHRKTNLISMSEDPNIVLTYDKTNLHRFVLIKLSKDEIEDSKKVFSAGEYLLGVMGYQIETQAQNAPLKVRQILERVDNASSIEEIIKIINGADRQVATSLVESKQQYLSEAEQLEQSKKIAKCKVLNYYGLMRGITHDEKDKLIDISGFTQIMRNGYSSSEWLYSGKIEQEKLIDIPKILVDALALVKQAEFQGKDKEILKEVEQEILSLAVYGTEINQDNYQLEYSAHNNLKSALTIDKAFEITGGQISYRDTNMQMTAIRSVAEMTLNKRKIIELLQERLPNINIDELLAGTYCINQEMTTRQNNRGSQIGRNINFIISDYSYDLDDKVSAQILQSIENLSDEQLSNIISKGVDAQEISNLLIKTRENDERIQSNESKRLSSRYIAEAIVEGYNWKKDSNSLTKQEQILLANTLLRGVKINNELYKLYDAINKIQIEKNKFTQNEVFAIMINLAIDGKVGELSYSDLLKKDRREIQLILLENQESIQTSVLPISIDLLAGRGKEISKLKKELIDLGLEKEFIESNDIKNVYVAKQILEGYKFETSLSQEEKISIIHEILNNSSLSKCQLSTLIKNIKEIGFSQQETYGLIINLSINSQILEEGNLGYSSLLQSYNKCQSISQYKEKIQTKVTSGTILKALSKNLNNADAKKLKEEMIYLGIDKEFLEIKDIQNIYVAKSIVEEYSFGEILTQEEEISLIKSILNHSMLNNGTNKLSTLIQNMERIGLSKQEIYGMIINLGINGIVLDKDGYGYTNLLANQQNACQMIAQYKGKIQTQVTNGTILKAQSENLNEKDIEQLITKLIVLGIDNELIASKNIKNIYTAIKIVNEYDFGEELSQTEKTSLITMLLNNNALNDGKSNYLTTLIQNIEKIGLNKQEIYGMIINLGINGIVLEETGFDYSTLLVNKNNACQTIAQYKDKIQTQVTKGGILKAQSENLNKKDIEKLTEELSALGIDREFLEEKDIRNVYIAKQIIEGYEFKRKIRNDEKGCLIKSILNYSRLNRNCFLTSLIYNLEQVGINAQDIYGMIINLGINGNIIEETGYSYGNLLQNSNNACQTIARYKAQMQTQVTETNILKAQSENLNKKDIEKLTEELSALGIDREFLEEKDIRNVYIAKQIIEGYSFEEKINQQTQALLIKALLSNKSLNKKNNRYLVDLIKCLEQIGLNKQDVYGTIINLGVNKSVLDERGYGYEDLLTNKKDACNLIVQYKDKIRTKVTKRNNFKNKFGKLR